MPTLPKLIYKLKEVPIKIPKVFFQNGKANHQIHVELQRTLNSQNNLGK